MENKFSETVKFDDNVTAEQCCEHMNGLDRDACLVPVPYGTWAVNKLKKPDKHSELDEFTDQLRWKALRCNGLRWRKVICSCQERRGL